MLDDAIVEENVTLEKKLNLKYLSNLLWFCSQTFKSTY